MIESLPKIKGYIVKNLIGEGGMANVYSAFRMPDKTRVAIKIIHDRIYKKDPKAVDAFVREAKFAAGLDHPNLLKTYALGKMLDGKPYIAMEFIKGKTLKEVLAEKKSLSVKNTLHIVSKVASALAYLHGMNIYHRDLKPSNIMLEEKTKRILLTDFGIASQAVDILDYKASKRVSGTILYMSPEQLRGDFLTGKTDMYSLGVCFYVLLVGIPPFISSDRKEIRKMHLTKPFPHLPGHLAFLDDILQKLCHKNAEQRYSAVDLLQALHRLKKQMKAEEEKQNMPAEVKKSKLKNMTSSLFKSIRSLTGSE